MSEEPVAPETNGVTVNLLATVDLGPEIEGMAGRPGLTRGSTGRATVSFASFRAPVRHNVGRFNI